MNFSTPLLVLVSVLAIQVAAQNFGRTGQSLSRPPLFNPVGLDYIPDFGFILGSQKYGNLYFVEDGRQIQLFSNDTSLVSSTGVRVDANRRLVYVANNASPLSNVASILSFSKKDGSLKASWNLSKLLAPQKPKQLANVAFDTLGNLYATDSLNGVVYLADRNGEASVWLKDIRLLAQDSLGVGVNGIYFYQGSDSSSRGYFLLTRSGNSEKASGLYRADIASKDLIRVSIDHGNYTGLFASFSSVVVNPRSGRAFAIGSDNLIYELASTDDYQTALLTAQYRVVCPNPVALQYVQSPYNDLYVLCNNGNTPYTIERVAVLNKINIIPFDNTRTTSSSAITISISLVLLVVLLVVSLV